jgi:hypothetical protein
MLLQKPPSDSCPVGCPSDTVHKSQDDRASIRQRLSSHTVIRYVVPTVTLPHKQPTTDTINTIVHTPKRSLLHTVPRQRGRLTSVLFTLQCSPTWLYIHDHQLGRPVTKTKVIKIQKTPQKGQIHSLGKLANLNLNLTRWPVHTVEIQSPESACCHDAYVDS